MFVVRNVSNGHLNGATTSSAIYFRVQKRAPHRIVLRDVYPFLRKMSIVIVNQKIYNYDRHSYFKKGHGQSQWGSQ